MHQPTNTLESHLLGHREKLLAFIRSKVSDPDLAEDILQDSLLKALQAAPELREDEKVVPWLYRIVRNAVTDAYRRRDRARRRADAYAQDTAEDALTPEDETVLCECVRDLIPTLKDEYRVMIEAVELGGADPETVADRLGLTRNNLKVRRHRARQQLRERLEQTCRTCATHGCLDCQCKQPPREAQAM